MAKLTTEELLDFLDKHEVTYASETRGGKRLRLTCRNRTYTVTHGDETLYTGLDVKKAVQAYNTCTWVGD